MEEIWQQKHFITSLVLSVSQFKASQSLQNPNEASNNGQQSIHPPQNSIVVQQQSPHQQALNPEIQRSHQTSPFSMGDLIIPPPGEPLDIKDWRRTYKNKEEPQLEKHCLHEDPFIQFDLWFKDVAKKDLSFEEINAVSLSTCSNNKPSSRMVLLKKYDPNGFAFYTNYTSRKGRELSENPNAAMLFYWPAVSRQVRIEGIVQKLSQEDADEYWVSRPLGSRIGSKSSHQSTEIPHRSVLEDETRRLEELAKKEGPDAITRPECWGGFILRPKYFEFWQGQPSRLHDRIIYEQTPEATVWKKKRLSP